MNYTIVIPAIIAFCISALLGPVVIPFLRKLKVGQTVRDEGPKTHLQKNGTPTMGGIIILISITVSCAEAFHGTSCMAENGTADRCNSNLCILYHNKIFHQPCNAYSVCAGKIS